LFFLRAFSLLADFEWKMKSLNLNKNEKLMVCTRKKLFEGFVGYIVETEKRNLLKMEHGFRIGN
jgi:hypothetical protein